MLKTLLTFKNNHWLLLLIYLFIPFLILNFGVIGENHYVYLTHSFLAGSLSLTDIPAITTDLAYFEGKYFWPSGPLPAVLLMPFVWLAKLNFQESFIKLPLSILNFWLVFRITKHLKLPVNKSLLIAIFFIFGSIYTPVAVLPFSVYLTQIVATSFLLIAIYCFLKRKSALLIGVTISMAALSRPTLFIAVIFFLIFSLEKPRRILFLKLLLPLLIAGAITSVYNFARFGSIFESGRNYQIVSKEQQKWRASGLFSTNHIPVNIYYMLFKPPDLVVDKNDQNIKPPFVKASQHGMAIWILSPILLLLLKTNIKDKLNKTALLTTLALLIPIVTYYGLGYKQIGYRYALDFLPFLLIPLAITLRKTNTKIIGSLVIAGTLITWFFIWEFLAGS